jgi:hypothetical protein
MGDLLQTSKDEWTPWTGGKPKVDWTGLDASAPTMFRSPNQQRSLYTKSATDGYNFRMTGLTTKFGKTDNFKQFSEKVMKHFKNTGLDMISYLPDPADPTRMLSVVTHHSRFSFDAVRDASDILCPSYDYYDGQNVIAAIDFFLLDSLSKDLKAIINLKMSESDSFVVIWMYLVGVVTSTSVKN